MSVIVRRGLAPAHLDPAAALWWEAFGPKLGRLLGPAPRGRAFVRRVMAPDHALGAIDGAIDAAGGGRLVGIAGFRTARAGFVQGTPADLAAVYGGFGGRWRRAALDALGQEVEPRVLVVDGLAVAPARQGEGIGARLLEALCAEAQGRGCRAIRLDVVRANARARALYERLGFRIAREERSWRSALAYDVRSTLVMTRAL